MLGVVVLNFNNYHETINCVYSLLHQKEVTLQIVVVDNGSSNNSFTELYKEFFEHKNVEILKLESNQGYANGNNYGIRLLQKKGIQNIFISNSDLKFQDEYSLKIISSSISNQIGLISPIIKNPNGELDKRVSFSIKNFYLRLFLHLVSFFFFNVGKKIKNQLLTQNSLLSDSDNLYIISGSGYLLTNEYFKFYNGLYNKTFLYGEEVATTLLLHKSNLKTKLVNCGSIIHLGGASTPSNIKFSNIKKHFMILKSYLSLFFLFIFSKDAIKCKLTVYNKQTNKHSFLCYVNKLLGTAKHVFMYSRVFKKKK